MELLMQPGHNVGIHRPVNLSVRPPPAGIGISGKYHNGLQRGNHEYILTPETPGKVHLSGGLVLPERVIPP